MRWKFIFRVSRDNSLAQGLRRRRGFHLIRGGTPHPARFAAHLPLKGEGIGDPRPSRGRHWGTRPSRGRHWGPRPSEGKALGRTAGSVGAFRDLPFTREGGTSLRSAFRFPRSAPSAGKEARAGNPARFFSFQDPVDGGEKIAVFFKGGKIRIGFPDGVGGAEQEARPSGADHL